jgi:hypothetical protein
VQAPQQSQVPHEQSEQSHASQSHLLQHVSHSQTSQVHEDFVAADATSFDSEQHPEEQACDAVPVVTLKSHELACDCSQQSPVGQQDFSAQQPAVQPPTELDTGVASVFHATETTAPTNKVAKESSVTLIIVISLLCVRTFVKIWLTKITAQAVLTTLKLDGFYATL